MEKVVNWVRVKVVRVITEKASKGGTAKEVKRPMAKAARRITMAKLAKG
jgi:hypothetical protein